MPQLLHAGRLALVLLPLLGCSPSPPETLWLGHVGEMPETLLQPLRERLQADDARHVRVRHALPGSNPRAVAVRLLAVHGVKGLILGPGVTHPAEVVAVARPYGVPVIVLDDNEPIDDAILLGARPGQRLQMLLDALTPHERLTPIRLLNASPPALQQVAAHGLMVDAQAVARLDAERVMYEHLGTRIEVLNDSATLVEAVNLLLREDTSAKPVVKLRVCRHESEQP